MPKRSQAGCPSVLAALLATTVLFVAIEAHAAGAVADAAITFEADAGVGDVCPTEGAFIEAVADALHRDARVVSPPRLLFDVVVTTSPRAVFGRITFRSDETSKPRHRSLAGAACHEVAEGLALIVALSIDPEVDMLEPVHITRLAPTKAPSPPREPDPPRLRPAPSASDPERQVVPNAELGMLADSGTMPRLGAGALVGAGVSLARSPRSSLLLEGVLFAPVSLDGAGGNVRFSALQARATLCPVGALLATSIELSPCIGGALTSLSTRSSGFVTNTPSSTASWSASIGVRQRVGLTKAAGLLLSTELFFAPADQAYEVRGYGVLFRAGGAGVRGAVALDARF